MEWKLLLEILDIFATSVEKHIDLAIRLANINQSGINLE